MGMCLAISLILESQQNGGFLSSWCQKRDVWSPNISQIVTQMYVDATIEALKGKDRLIWKQLTTLPGKACRI